MYDVNIVLKTLNNICAKNCSVFVTDDELKMPNGTSHPSGAPEFTLDFEWRSCSSIFSSVVFLVGFVLLYL
jgi:hypothetical protein